MKIQGLLLLIFASLACGVQSTLPVYESATHTQEVSTFVTSTPEMVQVVGSWNLREAPGESSALIDTLTNEQVRLIRCEPLVTGGVWCKVSSNGAIGWVNQRGLK